MLKRALHYAAAAVAMYASLQAGFLTYQAHQFLVEPYSTIAFALLALFTVALVATAVLALLGRAGYHVLALVVCVLAPSFLVMGIGRIASAPALEALKQAVCAAGVGLCFPQATRVMYAIPILAIVAVASLVLARQRPAPQSGA